MISVANVYMLLGWLTFQRLQTTILLSAGNYGSFFGHTQQKLLIVWSLGGATKCMFVTKMAMSLTRCVVETF